MHASYNYTLLKSQTGAFFLQILLGVKYLITIRSIISHLMHATTKRMLCCMLFGSLALKANEPI